MDQKEKMRKNRRLIGAGAAIAVLLLGGILLGGILLGGILLAARPAPVHLGETEAEVAAALHDPDADQWPTGPAPNPHGIHTVYYGPTGGARLMLLMGDEKVVVINRFDAGGAMTEHQEDAAFAETLNRENPNQQAPPP